jgi:hypothetical protein
MAAAATTLGCCTRCSLLHCCLGSDQATPLLAGDLTYIGPSTTILPIRAARQACPAMPCTLYAAPPCSLAVAQHSSSGMIHPSLLPIRHGRTFYPVSVPAMYPQPQAHAHPYAHFLPPSGTTVLSAFLGASPMPPRFVQWRPLLTVWQLPLPCHFCCSFHALSHRVPALHAFRLLVCLSPQSYVGSPTSGRQQGACRAACKQRRKAAQHAALQARNWHVHTRGSALVLRSTRTGPCQPTNRW